MTREKTIAALENYLKEYHRIKRVERETADTFALELSQTNNLETLASMWRRNFTSSPQRRQLIKERMKAVISDVIPENIPGCFTHFLDNPIFILDCFSEVFSEKAEGLLKALEETEKMTQGMGCSTET